MGAPQVPSMAANQAKLNLAMIDKATAEGSKSNAETTVGTIVMTTATANAALTQKAGNKAVDQANEANKDGLQKVAKLADQITF